MAISPNRPAFATLDLRHCPTVGLDPINTDHQPDADAIAKQMLFRAKGSGRPMNNGPTAYLTLRSTILHDAYSQAIAYQHRKEKCEPGVDANVCEMFIAYLKKLNQCLINGHPLHKIALTPLLRMENVPERTIEHSAYRLHQAVRHGHDRMIVTEHHHAAEPEGPRIHISYALRQTLQADWENYLTSLTDVNMLLMQHMCQRADINSPIGNNEPLADHQLGIMQPDVLLQQAYLNLLEYSTSVDISRDLVPDIRPEEQHIREMMTRAREQEEAVSTAISMPSRKLFSDEETSEDPKSPDATFRDNVQRAREERNDTRLAHMFIFHGLDQHLHAALSPLSEHRDYDGVVSPAMRQLGALPAASAITHRVQIDDTFLHHRCRQQRDDQYHPLQPIHPSTANFNEMSPQQAIMTSTHDRMSRQVPIEDSTARQEHNRMVSQYTSAAIHQATRHQMSHLAAAQALVQCIYSNSNLIARLYAKYPRPPQMPIFASLDPDPIQGSGGIIKTEYLRMRAGYGPARYYPGWKQEDVDKGAGPTYRQMMSKAHLRFANSRGEGTRTFNPDHLQAQDMPAMAISAYLKGHMDNLPAFLDARLEQHRNTKQGFSDREDLLAAAAFRNYNFTATTEQICRLLRMSIFASIQSPPLYPQQQHLRLRLHRDIANIADHKTQMTSYGTARYDNYTRLLEVNPLSPYEAPDWPLRVHVCKKAIDSYQRCIDDADECGRRFGRRGLHDNVACIASPGIMAVHMLASERYSKQQYDLGVFATTVHRQKRLDSVDQTAEDVIAGTRVMNPECRLERYDDILDMPLDLFDLQCIRPYELGEMPFTIPSAEERAQRMHLLHQGHPPAGAPMINQCEPEPLTVHPGIIPMSVLQAHDTHANLSGQLPMAPRPPKLLDTLQGFPEEDEVMSRLAMPDRCPPRMLPVGHPQAAAPLDDYHGGIGGHQLLDVATPTQEHVVTAEDAQRAIAIEQSTAANTASNARLSEHNAIASQDAPGASWMSQTAGPSHGHQRTLVARSDDLLDAAEPVTSPVADSSHQTDDVVDESAQPSPTVFTADQLAEQAHRLTGSRKAGSSTRRK